MKGIHDGSFRSLPIDAAVGDGHAVFQLRLLHRKRLVAGEEIAFEHGPDDGFVSVLDLTHDVLEYAWLQFRVLSAVAMAAIDHDRLRQASFLQVGDGASD